MNSMIEAFDKIYHHNDMIRVFFSPGRVNIIGEHIDYNGGLVFPAAISIGTYGAIRSRTDHIIRLYSSQFTLEGIVHTDLSNLSFNQKDGWANYAKGVLDLLKKRGYELPFGFDLYIEGNLPTASGLSSSASLEVLVAYIANELYHLKLSRVDIALLAQEVENDYMGMHCGIMDQLIIACGIKDKALLMNTATLEMETSNATFSQYQWMIMNTNYQRKTTESKYNERVNECSQGLKILKEKYDIKYLCELNLTDLPNIRKMIKDDIIYQRVKHAITEQDRTIQSKEMMTKGDALGFARLLNESHQSLKNDYQVTGYHLDTLVEAALNHGAIGARVTGAGFGGCAIALVENKNVLTLKQQVSQIYKDLTGLDAQFFEVTFENGVHEVK
ncbi:MAG: galactokinase [Acholeplasmataceae bacterium]|nr:galactokinase [Acholeplasmataceae bacterium]